MARIGPHGAILALGVFCLLAAAPLAGMPGLRPPPSARGTPSVLSAMGDGLRYVRRSRPLVALLGVAFVAMLGFGGLSVLDVVFVTRVLHRPANDVGLLLAASGLGEAAGAVGVLVAGR